MNLRTLGRGLVALAILLLPSLADAQGIPAFQSGTLIPGHLLKGAGNGLHMDVGGLTGDANGRGASPFSITDGAGSGLCLNTAPTGGQHYESCFGHDFSGNAIWSVTANGGAINQSVYLSKNGTLYEIPFVGAGSGNVVGPNSSTVDTCALWNNSAGTALKIGNCVVAPGSAQSPTDLAVWDAGTNAVTGTGGAFGVSGSGLGLGNHTPTSSGKAITVINAYNGSDISRYGLFANLDYRPPSDISSANATGIYGDLWLNAPHSIGGLNAAGRFNAYTIPQIGAVVTSAGTGYTNGDIVTLVGGTCNTLLNTPPQFQLTVTAGVVTAAPYYAESAGACTFYPPSPVSVTGGSGSGLTLTLTGNTLDATYLVGVYGRPRHTSFGTITNAVSVFADGAYNAGTGTVTNTMGVWLQTPYDTNQTNAYGIYQAGSFKSGTIVSSDNNDITINPGGAGIVSSTKGIAAGIGQTCQALMLGGSNTQLQATGVDCYAFVQAQGAGKVVLATNGGLAAAQFSAPLLAVNAVDVEGAVAAAPPTIGVTGTDANINLRLNAKGAGAVVAGTATAGSFGLQYATSAAAVPGNFAANRYIQITANGVTVYVPAMLASW